MAILYADENFDYPITERLRLLGHDVLTVQEAGRRGEDDGQVLAYATSVGRAVLTFDRHDFKRLHRLSPFHAGIISCTWDANYDALAQRIDQELKVDGSLAGQHIRINRTN